jgi:hypothetical protein
MIGERVPNVGEHVRFFLKGHLSFEVCVCVSSFPAHISGFPVLLCSSSQIGCQFGRGVHHQLLILIDFTTSNLVSIYVQQQCSAFFSFFVLFFSVFLGGEFFFFFSFFFFFLLHFLSFPFLGAVLLSFFRP